MLQKHVNYFLITIIALPQFWIGIVHFVTIFWNSTFLLKITLTINVAQILAQIGKIILLFDFDPQTNLTNTLLDNPIDKNGISKWILGADKDTLIETI